MPEKLTIIEFINVLPLSGNVPYGHMLSHFTADGSTVYVYMCKDGLVMIIRTENGDIDLVDRCEYSAQQRTKGHTITKDLVCLETYIDLTDSLIEDVQAQLRLTVADKKMTFEEWESYVDAMVLENFLKPV